MEILYCKYCNKQCKNKKSLSQHEIRCSENINKIKTKHSEETKRKLSQVMKVVNTNSERIWNKDTLYNMSIKSKEINKNYWTDMKKKEHSILMKSVVEKHPDSYSINNISGRTKIYNHNGFKLKGKWELKIAILLDKYNIKWTNIIKPFPYFWNDKWHLYFPDFYLIDYDKYIEVKGFERERDLIKWQNINKTLIIIKSKEMNMLDIDDFKIKEMIEN